MDLSPVVPECSLFGELLITLIAFVIQFRVARSTTVLHLVFGQVTDVDQLSAQVAHPFPLVEADIVVQDALLVVLLNVTGGDIFLALRTTDIPTRGVVLGLHVFQDGSGGPEVSSLVKFGAFEHRFENDYKSTSNTVISYEIVSESNSNKKNLTNETIPDIVVAAYRALELAPKVLPDPVSVLHGMVGKYQVANRASVSFLAIDEE